MSTAKAEEVAAVPSIVPSLGRMRKYTVVSSVFGRSVPAFQLMVRLTVEVVLVSILEIKPVAIVGAPVDATIEPNVDDAHVELLVEYSTRRLLAELTSVSVTVAINCTVDEPETWEGLEMVEEGAELGDTGVAVTVPLAVPCPFEFTAETRKSYDEPFVSAVTTLLVLTDTPSAKVAHVEVAVSLYSIA